MLNWMGLKHGAYWLRSFHYQELHRISVYWIEYWSSSLELSSLNELSEWETLKTEYETQAETALPDRMLVTTLLSRTTGTLRQHLKMNVRLLDTYDATKNVITEYHQSRHVTGSESLSDISPAPMDIGSMWQGKEMRDERSEGSHWKGKGRGKLETSEAHDLLFIIQSILTADQTAKNESALLWAQTSLLLHRWLVAWLMGSIDFFLPYQAQKAPATALFSPRCTAADAVIWYHWRQLRHCSPAAGFHTILTLMRNSTVSEDVDQTMLRSSLGLRSRVMWLPLGKLPKLCALLQHWALPWRFWTLGWSQSHCSQMDRWTVGSLLVQHCCVPFKCTGLWHHSHWTNQWLSFVTIPHFTVFWQLRQSTSWRQILSTSLAL